MSLINIRLAQPNDLPELANIWYEKMVLQQQSDTRLILAEHARQKWVEYAANFLEDGQSAIWVVEHSNDLAGYVMACLHDTLTGLQQQKTGCISEMALDIHNPQPGLGQHLLLAARGWFEDHQVENIIVYVPHRQVVDQAFWRAQGATEWMDVMWLKR